MAASYFSASAARTYAYDAFSFENAYQPVRHADSRGLQLPTASKKLISTYLSYFGLCFTLASRYPTKNNFDRILSVSRSDVDVGMAPHSGAHHGAASLDLRPAGNSNDFAQSISGQSGDNGSDSAGPLPSISLPKGGGSIGGMGEKFNVNSADGTGTSNIPIRTSPCRGGFAPSLSLSYSTGNGNGPFGLGWSLSETSITRKTTKGLPQYNDHTDSDVFLLGGMEDLVPLFRKDEHDAVLCDKDTGQPVLHEESRDGFRIRRYSPRIEGSFMRIERWTSIANPGEVHWRVTSPENVTSVYGSTTNAQLFDPCQTPNQDHRTFSWLLSEQYDMSGNAIAYTYKEEDSIGVDFNATNERNRTDKSRSSNRYLKTIRYGNKMPNRDPETWHAFSSFSIPEDDWMFTVVLDYGEIDEESPKFDDSAPWCCRKDPFSSYRSGFEIRTYRLCKRILMFHNFPTELSRDHYLVSSTNLKYTQESSITYLQSAMHVSYLLDGDMMTTKSLPPVEFEYSTFPRDEVLLELCAEDIDPISVQNMPSGVGGLSHQWADLDGEGLPGVLIEQDRGWFYKRNQSANNAPNTGRGHTIAPAFGPLEGVFSKPPLTFRSARGSLRDVQGDGLLDMVEMDNVTWGFFRREVLPNQGWAPFQEFKAIPNLRLGNVPSTFVDLTGDGLADIFITEDNAFVYYPSLGEEGYGEPSRIFQSLDEEKGPRLLLGDFEQTIHLADMSGDGLADLVRIRNGEVCYWPNTGYGRFGAKVTMDNGPWFHNEGSYNPRFLHVADIDGSGTSDLLYISPSGIDIFLNNAGNGFSARKRLSHVFPVDRFSTVETLDILGNGTTCIVWSSRLPGYSQASMKYIDLTRGKPHLLVGQKNNYGRQTRIKYAPSTKFYLDDRQAGVQWITTLPFPVQCVERVETFDQVSGNRFSSRYAYHHGFYDGFEREFRGFAMVEQWDTEEFDESLSATNLDRRWFSPPVHTKSWFSTGNFLGEGSSQLVSEYFKNPESHGTSEGISTTLLEDSVIPSGLNLNMTREACRALKGHLLRLEVYSDDKSRKAHIPYTVTESNYTARLLQPEDVHGHGIFDFVPRETMQLNLERNLSDPRIQHGLAVEVDEYGNTLKSIQIAYGRKSSPLKDVGDRECQERLLITYSENLITNKIDDSACYRLPRVYESRSYQLYGYENEHVECFGMSRFPKNELARLSAIPYEASPNGGKQKRLLGRSRTLFRSDDLEEILPAGRLESMAFPGESFSQAFTPGLLQNYRRPNPDARQPTWEDLIPNANEILGLKGGGHVDLDSDGNWWIPSGRSFFHKHQISPKEELAEGRKHFFLPKRFVDPFGNSSTVAFDQFDLLPTESVDALHNVVKCTHDYRVLQAYLVVDPNGNRSQCAFDELGHVVATAVMGKEGENQGDSLDTFRQATQKEIEQFFLEPHGPLQEVLLGNATTRVVYNFSRFWREPGAKKKEPIFQATIAREAHTSDPVPGKLKTQISFSYLDGMGRTIQTKAQARPKYGVQKWITSGWTIVNNKGNPVRQFEPFFDESHEYISDQKVGVSLILIYDAVDRVIATINPNHTWQKSTYDNWTSKKYDSNDTVLMNPQSDPDIGQFVKLLPEDYYLPTWYEQRISGQMGQDQKVAAQKSAKHSNTPAIVHLDILGRSFLSVADNGEYGEYTTRSRLDIQGRIQHIKDAKNRLVQTYTYNMVGSVINQNNLESGERWTMFDIGGGSLVRWDARSNRFRTLRDELGRTVATFLQQGENGCEMMIEKFIYGESLTRRNQNEGLVCVNGRGKIVKVYDQAGVLEQATYDFKGNLLYSDRQLAKNYKNILDWNEQVPLEDEVFVSQSTFDALNRCVELTSADDSVVYHMYDEAGHLQSLTGRIRDSDNHTSFVRDTEYNARGQRTSIQYGNGTDTHYSYDLNTFALVHTLTRRDERNSPDDQSKSPTSRSVAGSQVQNLHYTFDAVGNVTKITDVSQQRIFHKNIVVDPSNEYTYDPLYRLINATGREHLSLAKKPTAPGKLFTPSEHKNDGMAMSRYLESYGYDEVGNFVSMQHQNTSSSAQGWTRHYSYSEPSLLEPGVYNNRLSRTSIGSTTENYRYEGNAARHGNITSMPNLPLMKWDSQDQLRATARSISQNGVPETTWYVYDSAGQRVRKVTESYAGLDETPHRIKERIYVGVEIFRRFDGQGDIKLERQTLHVSDASGTVTMIETRTVGEEPHVPEQIFRYQLDNNVRSVCLELDEQARLLTYEEYTPYGATSYEAVGSQIGAPKRYGYTGKERDGENGLYYYGARYYCPATARWINCDPIGITGGLDAYIYVRCNPINFIDPDGRMSSDASSAL
ncbi:hypothetical protein G7Y89_g14312 [Cudoniella acicularis]|uniref:SpvB-domain-containing protein n=1 Tax=Cudoniella acicularis TaxID=354080 RepID=A0A8H4R3D2_9HELO|nr:hypothetical protein G7Y89_g14312 [Cudoniella acicularis]